MDFSFTKMDCQSSIQENIFANVWQAQQIISFFYFLENVFKNKNKKNWQNGNV